MKFSKQFLISAAEKVGGAYVLAFLALLNQGGISGAKSAAAAGLAAAIAAAYSLVAKFVGDPNVASLVDGTKPAA